LWRDGARCLTHEVRLASLASKVAALGLDLAERNRSVRDLTEELTVARKCTRAAAALALLVFIGGVPRRLQSRAFVCWQHALLEGRWSKLLKTEVASLTSRLDQQHAKATASLTQAVQQTRAACQAEAATVTERAVAEALAEAEAATRVAEEKDEARRAVAMESTAAKLVSLESHKKLLQHEVEEALEAVEAVEAVHTAAVREMESRCEKEMADALACTGRWQLVKNDK
jgi:hypothetical protein